MNHMTCADKSSEAIPLQPQLESPFATSASMRTDSTTWRFDSSTRRGFQRLRQPCRGAKVGSALCAPSSRRRPFVGAGVRGIRNLHAKLYVFGSDRSIVTSANLTEPALTKNAEFGRA